jgi:hypothetical protein
VYAPDWIVGLRPVLSPRRLGLLTVLALVLLSPRCSRAQAQSQGRPDPPRPQQGKPDPVAADRPDLPVLRTILVPRDWEKFHLQMVDASLPPRDRQGIWGLDFSYKPLRIKTIDVPGKGRKQILYMYYKVVNHTSAPRQFTPQFIMINEKDEKFEDSVVPQAIPAIQMREDATIPILGGVNIMGILPPSTKPDVDDAVYGVATWEKWDPKAERISIYVRGLSDGRKEIPPPNGGKPSLKYKTLKIDFICEPDLRLADPPHEWVYW